MKRTSLIALALLALVVAPAVPSLASHLHRHHASTMSATRHRPIVTSQKTLRTHSLAAIRTHRATPAEQRFTKPGVVRSLTAKHTRRATPLRSRTHHAIKTLSTKHKLRPTLHLRSSHKSLAMTARHPLAR